MPATQLTTSSPVRNAAVVALFVFFLALLVAPPAQAATIGTGAVSIKGPGSELVPEVTVDIRKDACDGARVWHTTTTNRADAYGAFGIGLTPGVYCIITLNVPAPYEIPANVVFTMENRAANWVTVWLPGPPPVVSGALVAKDEQGAGINGVAAHIATGDCGQGGGGVWQNTTASNQWSTGGFGVSLTVGTYCATALSAPPGYSLPQPSTFEVTAPGPIWITLWSSRIPYAGDSNSVISVDILSGSKIVEFSCPRCAGYTSVWADSTDGSSDLLVNTVGAYSGRTLPGFLDWTSVRYDSLEITADSAWTLQLLDVSSARQVGSSFSGSGDDVVLVNAPGNVATMSHHGSGYFGVWSVDYNGDVNLLANTVGDFWGRVPALTPALMKIESEGNWQLDIG